MRGAEKCSSHALNLWCEERWSELDYDQLLKEGLTAYFPNLMRVFFPALAQHLDLSQYAPLDKETLSPTASGKDKAQRRFPDLALSVKTQEQKQEVVLVHLEPQTYHRRNMAFRMFEYYTGLRLKYRCPVIPIVVYLRKGVDASMGEYQEGFHEEEYLRLRYHILSLPDLPAEPYLASGDPFAASLSGWMRWNSKDRVSDKLACARVVMGSGLGYEGKRLLLHLLDAGLELSDVETSTFLERFVSEYSEEEGSAMQYIPSWERLALKRGREEGREEGVTSGRLTGGRAILLRLLQQKFGLLPLPVLERIQRETDLAQLETWSLKLLDATSLEEIGL